LLLARTLGRVLLRESLHALLITPLTPQPEAIEHFDTYKTTCIVE
jgi:hypothetical protein